MFASREICINEKKVKVKVPKGKVVPRRVFNAEGIKEEEFSKFLNKFKKFVSNL